MGRSTITVVRTSVFQNGPNGGNPCPVVLDGDELTAEDGKHLAATFGAETIILRNPEKSDSDFGIRYFVPKYEMEMCVHGTIAATTVLQRTGRISRTPVRFETLLGQILVEWMDDGDELNVTVFQFPYSVHQGHAMGKPSLLKVSAYLEKDSITKTSVSGNAHVLSEETFFFNQVNPSDSAGAGNRAADQRNRGI